MALISVYSGTVEEWMDQIRNWLADQTIDMALNAVVNKIVNEAGWKGQAAQAFIDTVEAQIQSQIQAIRDKINEFLSTLDALLIAIQAVELYMSGPVGWVAAGGEALINAVDDIY